MTIRNEHDEDISELVWAAGVVSVLGTLAAVKVIRKQKWGYALYTRLQVGSRGNATTIERLGKIMDVEVKTVKVAGKPRQQVTLNAEDLHEFMKEIWPWVSLERKLEYKKVRQAVAASKITGNMESGPE
jgi:hypothetical protein